MGDRYLVAGTVNCAPSPGATALVVVASTLTRGRIHFINLSHTGTPVADNLIEWKVRRVTGGGTSTSVTPTPVDAASPAAQLSAQQTYTSEPTFGAPLLDLGVHQRAYWQWQALPGSEIIIPAVSGAGVGFTAQNASFNSTVNAVTGWEE